VFSAVMDGRSVQIVALNQDIFSAADPDGAPRSGAVDDGIPGDGDIFMPVILFECLRIGIGQPDAGSYPVSARSL